MLEFHNVSKIYPRKIVFQKLTANFAQSSCILGENGLGKTTLLLLAAGLEPCTTGAILLNGKTIEDKTTQTQIALASDKICLPEFMTAEQLIHFHCQQFNLKQPHQLIEQLHFSPFITANVTDLSLGNHKKLQLILAFARNTPWLLLDEPSAALDHQAKQVLINLISNYQGNILLTSHDKNFVAELEFPCIELTELISHD